MLLGYGSQERSTRVVVVVVVFTVSRDNRYELRSHFQF